MSSPGETPAPGRAHQRTSRRVRREQRTVDVMIHMYCSDHHVAAGDVAPAARGAGLCPDCAALREYAERRVQRCPFADAKPTCARCTVHCYRPVQREQIRAVMRYSGPRMTYRHPYLALRHLLDRRRTPDPTATSPGDPS